MTHHDVATRPATDRAPTTHEDFLQQEFPDWEFMVGESESWDGSSRPLWIATREGHHPQSELSAAKLHTRLTNYHEREAQRNAHRN